MDRQARAGEFRVFEPGRTTRVQGDTDGDGAAGVSIRLVGLKTADHSTSDFWL